MNLKIRDFAECLQVLAMSISFFHFSQCFLFCSVFGQFSPLPTTIHDFASIIPLLVRCLIYSNYLKFMIVLFVRYFIFLNFDLINLDLLKFSPNRNSTYICLKFKNTGQIIEPIIFYYVIKNESIIKIIFDRLE